MIPLDYAEYRPWKILDQGTEGTCQAHAFFGMLMECVEGKFKRKVEFDVEKYFEIIKDIYKSAPKNEGSKPRQWYYYEYAMEHGFRTKTKETVRIKSFRHCKYDVDMKNHDLITQALQISSPVQISIRTFKNYPLNIDEEILPPLPSKLVAKGGHSMVIIGFDRKLKRYLVMNSWGEDVPPKWMPWDVFERVCMQYFFLNDLTLIA